MVDTEPKGLPLMFSEMEVEAALRNTATELYEALAALHDLRQFVLHNATQWKAGANHHNPIWVRIAETLDKHGLNDPDGRDGHGYLHSDPRYYCA